MKLISILSILLIFTFEAQASEKCKDVSRFAKNPVELEEMKEIAKTGSATIVDVNSLKSFKKNKIGKSIHFMSNKEKFASLLPKDKSAPIVAYCGGKLCSAWKRAAKAACESGYTNIRHFPDGISGWKKQVKI